jgi:hypothetical protein
MHHYTAEMGGGGYNTCAGPQDDAKGHASPATATISLGHQDKRRRAQAGGGSEPAVNSKDARGRAAESADEASAEAVAKVTAEGAATDIVVEATAESPTEPVTEVVAETAPGNTSVGHLHLPPREAKNS